MYTTPCLGPTLIHRKNRFQPPFKMEKAKANIHSFCSHHENMPKCLQNHALFFSPIGNWRCSTMWTETQIYRPLWGEAGSRQALWPQVEHRAMVAATDVSERERDTWSVFEFGGIHRWGFFHKHIFPWLPSEFLQGRMLGFEWKGTQGNFKHLLSSFSWWLHSYIYHILIRITRC